MKNCKEYIGLDVSKDTIAVAIADEGRQYPRYWGSIPHKPESIRKLVKKLGAPNQLEFCYEAGLQDLTCIVGLSLWVSLVQSSSHPSFQKDQVII